MVAFQTVVVQRAVAVFEGVRGSNGAADHTEDRVGFLSTVSLRRVQIDVKVTSSGLGCPLEHQVQGSALAIFGPWLDLGFHGNDVLSTWRVLRIVVAVDHTVEIDVDIVENEKTGFIGVAAQGAILVRKHTQDAKCAGAVRIPLVAKVPVEDWRPVIGFIRVLVFGIHGHARRIQIEWTSRLQTDGATQGTLDHFGRRRFDHFDRGQKAGGKVLEVDAVAAVTHRGTTVELNTVLRQTANRNLGAHTEVAVDGNTGDTLQRLGNVVVGQFADVFGDDCIDDTVVGALQFRRSPQRAANTDHDDFFEAFSLLFVGGILCHGRRCSD